MSEPILDQINLVVSDVEATVEFYRRLGLDIPETDPAFQNHHRSAQLAEGIDFDIDSVEFARHWDEGCNVRIDEYLVPIATALGVEVQTPMREPERSHCRIGKPHERLGYAPRATFENTMDELLALAGRSDGA